MGGGLRVFKADGSPVRYGKGIEFWNRPAGVKSHNIVFEGNTCVNAGFVWSHAQRPDPNGCHLSFYHNPSLLPDDNHRPERDFRVEQYLKRHVECQAARVKLNKDVRGQRVLRVQYPCACQQQCDNNNCLLHFVIPFVFIR